MPRISLPIADVYLQVERKIAIDMAKTVIRIAGLTDDIPISFPGKAEEQPLQGSRNDKDRDEGEVNLKHGSKLSVNFSEEYEEQDILTTTVHQKNNLNLFADASLGIRMCPVYIPTTGTLSLVYRCEDEFEATQFRDRFRIKCSENRSEFTLSADYEYSMPKQFMLILAEIHRLRENVAGYGESFRQYFDAHVSDKSTILLNMAGKQALQVFKERQDNIVAWFDFTTPPTINKEQNGAVRTVEFEFKYRYEKPAHMYMQWPILVHQQLLSKVYRGDTTDKSFDKMQGSRSKISQSMEYFRNMAVFPSGVQAGVRIPYFDEWINRGEHPDTENIITMALSIEKADMNNKLNIGTLAYYKIDPKIQEFMKARPSWQTQYGKSPFLITVYENDSRVMEQYVTLDDQLNLHLNFIPDLRKVYRLQISLLLNLTVIQQNFIEALREYPDVCTMVLQALFPKEVINVKYVAGKIFPKKELWEYIRRASKTPKHYLLNPERLQRRIGIFIVDTRSETK